MPEPVSNHAVAAADVGGNLFVYTFSGIDTSKIYSGIHARCFKYDVSNDAWTSLPPLPGGKGRIAAAASHFKGKIYVVGGYEVLSTNAERSLREVHVFDPQTDSFLPDARSLFFPIDDHVQAVWRDSLLYVITGWSNTTNLMRVQVYEPVSDLWREATSVPNNDNYKVFGGSGTIIGDTIYYAGGASDNFNFPPTRYFRKGVINPNNPLQITWMGWTTDEALGYRMAASSLYDDPLWIGGSQVTYNFDGIAYNGSGGVPPLGTVKKYDVEIDSFQSYENVFPPHMDYRGLGKLSVGQFILAGGMMEDQIVSDRTFLLSYDEPSGMLEIGSDFHLSVFPNPFNEMLQIQTNAEIHKIVIYDHFGHMLNVIFGHSTRINWSYGNGLHFLDIYLENGMHMVKKIIHNK